MYNGFLHEQRLSREKMIDTKQILEKRRKQLILNYNKRIHQFVTEMAEKPIVQTEYTPPLLVAPRYSNPALFKGSSIILAKKYLPEKQRIPRTIENYTFLSQNVPRHLSSRVNKKTYFKGANWLASQNDKSAKNVLKLCRVSSERHSLLKVHEDQLSN